MLRFIRKVHYVVSAPLAILAILSSSSIHPSYRMGILRKFALGWRMFWNSVRIRTATSYKSHLVMALKLLETPPEVRGDVVECGSFKGGSAANLSLVCHIVGRKLMVYDSFEGLPNGVEGDREAALYSRGDYCGSLEEVRTNIARHGALEVCEFIPGWFEDTLPQARGAVVLAFLDVDLEASLDTCVRHVWPRLIDGGHLFTDEAVGLDYSALFFSEKWWSLNFGQAPPGLMGAGTGLPLGEYYIGPLAELRAHPLWHPNGVGYTRKGLSGVWTFYRSDAATVDAVAGTVDTRRRGSLD